MYRTYICTEQAVVIKMVHYILSFGLHNRPEWEVKQIELLMPSGEVDYPRAQCSE